MTNEEYQQFQDKVMRICKEIRYMDFDSFIAQINHTLAFGPVADPTLFRKAQINLHNIKKSALALLLAQDQLPDFEEIIKGLSEAQGESHGK